MQWHDVLSRMTKSKKAWPLAGTTARSYSSSLSHCVRYDFSGQKALTSTRDEDRERWGTGCVNIDMVVARDLLQAVASTGATHSENPTQERSLFAGRTYTQPRSNASVLPQNVSPRCVLPSVSDYESIRQETKQTRADRNAREDGRRSRCIWGGRGGGPVGSGPPCQDVLRRRAWKGGGMFRW